MSAVRHPDSSVLALFSGGDLGPLDKWRVGAHVRRCAECSEYVEAFRRDRALLSASATELPDGLRWDRLAAEMTANIRVGLAAGECVGRSRTDHTAVRLSWRPAAALAAITVLLVGGWWLNMPTAQPNEFLHALRRTWKPAYLVQQQRLEAGVSVGANGDGLEVKQNGAVMTLMNPGTRPSVVTASTGGQVRARYVDTDTGQVTITNVYAQ